MHNNYVLILVAKIKAGACGAEGDPRTEEALEEVDFRENTSGGNPAVYAPQEWSFLFSGYQNGIFGLFRQTVFEWENHETPSKYISID